jgi:hypothetical protein
MDPLARLEAIEDIKQLKARYFRGLDTKQWDIFRSVFADDVVFDLTGTVRGSARDSAVYRGGDETVATVRASVGRAVTVHLGLMPEITVLSETEAEGIWKMEDVVTFPDGAPEDIESLRGVRRLHGYGHYEERYRKIDGEWKIAHCALTRITVELDREELPAATAG